MRWFLLGLLLFAACNTEFTDLEKEKYQALRSLQVHHLRTMDLTPDAQMCLKDNESVRILGCIVRYAQDTQNSTLCDQVFGNDDSFNCHILTLSLTEGISYCQSSINPDQCFYSLSVHHKDSTICEYITDKSKRNCLKPFAKAGDTRICDSKEGLDYDECLGFVAELSGNVTLCDMIDLTLLDECLDKVAYTTQNPDNCLTITDDETHDWCLMGAMSGDYSRSANYTACNHIRNASTRSFCVVEKAIHEEESSLCLDLDEYWQDSCLSQLARAVAKRCDYEDYCKLRVEGICSHMSDAEECIEDAYTPLRYY